jgi:uncharacterized protein (TIGR00255 family)
MTGFGQATVTAGGYSIHIDVKSVNHRYCEIVVRLPKEWLALEDALRKKAAERIKRGRADLYVTVERLESGRKTVVIDWQQADGYVQAAEQLCARYGLQDTLSLHHLLQLPDLIRQVEERAEIDESPEPGFTVCLTEALDGLLQMRNTEGSFLANDLLERLSQLETQVTEIKAHTPQVVADYAAKLKNRIAELLQGGIPLDEARLATEIALYADRCSIEEELTRLTSHFRQFADLLKSDEPVGRKLDFLIQEMNREVNTIGSKANDAEIAVKVIDMKAELEKMREQVQNIE